MTKTTKEIFESYEIRKTPVQKKKFRDYAVSTAKSMGYDARVEKMSKSCNNIVVGDPEKADVVYTAHYDTCAYMPFPNFITPKCIPLYILYQIAITVALLAVPYALIISSNFIANPIVKLTMILLGFVLMIGTLIMMMNGPANKHTANDNTSGVTLLFDIMRDLPEENRGKAAFIFFDLEERGLVGSGLYMKKHKFMEKKLLINFDCVSDGRNILFVVKKGAIPKMDILKEAFPSDDTYNVELASKNVIYPSDQKAFKCGVGVSALNKTAKGLLYMNKIHTPKDTVYDEENIVFLKCGAIRLVEML